MQLTLSPKIHNFRLNKNGLLLPLIVFISIWALFFKSNTSHLILEAISFLLILVIIGGKFNKQLYSTIDIYRFIWYTAIILGLYLIPLPTEIWLQLPGRDTYKNVISILEQSNQPFGWHSISLDSYATAKSLLALLPPLAVFSSTACLNTLQLQRLTIIILMISALQASLGIYQYFSSGAAHGSFANYNHYAALMGLTLPLSWALLAQSLSDHHKFYIKHILYGSLGVLIFIGGLLSTSRAGSAGIVLGIIASLFALGKQKQFKKPLTVLLLLALLTFILLSSLKINITLLPSRFTTLNLWEDPRWIIFEQALKGSWAFFPLGSGPGTFADTFTAFQPLGRVGEMFVNHVHNDYIELLFETGIIGIVIIIVFLTSFLRQTYKIIIKNENIMLREIKIGAAIGLTTGIMHSCFEFNFHITPYAVFFAITLGIFYTNIPSTKVIAITADRS